MNTSTRPFYPSDPLSPMERDALAAYRHMAAAMPEMMISMLMTEATRYEDPSHALDALADCGADIGESLAAKSSESARRACTELACMCAYHDPESLHILCERLPQLWSLARHDEVFQALTDALSSSWDEPMAAARLSAERAESWEGMGLGLSPLAWIELANQGGPAWIAFRDRHAKAAEADPKRLPPPADFNRLSWKGAARLIKHAGMGGYGASGAWIQDLRDRNPSISSRLSAALGLRELSEEIATESHRDKAIPAMGVAISMALSSGQDSGAWNGFIERAIEALTNAGIDPAELVCPVFRAYGLPQRDASWSESTGSPAGKATLAELLAMHPSPRHRALGFSMGCGPEQALAKWRSCALSGVKTTPSLGGDLEGYEIAMAADAASYARGTLGDMRAKPRLRI